MQSALTNGGCQQSSSPPAPLSSRVTRTGRAWPAGSLLVAIVTSRPQRIGVYKPIDEADRIDDWVYLPEVLYAFMLIMVVSAGAGPYSLDAYILGLIDKRGA